MNQSFDQCNRPINFLPDWFVHQRRRQAWVRRQYMIAGTIVCGLLILWGSAARRTHHLATYLDELNAQVVTAEGQVSEMTRLQQQRDQLIKQVRLYNRIVQPVSYSQVCGTMSSLVPEEVSLSELQVRTEQVRQPRLVSVAGARTKDSNKPQPIVETRKFVTVEMQGYAPSNLVIANLVSRLASSNLFREVKMVQSQEVQVGDALARQFRITMQVPLDRRYVQVAEGVADAG
jgi:hypothetical protein